jgi:hypothetical protein
MHTKTLPFCIVLCLLGAGCSTSPVAPGTSVTEDRNVVSQAINPCDLITKDEAAGYLGKPVQDGKHTTRTAYPYGDSCVYAIDWKPGDSTEGITRTVNIRVTQKTADMDTRAFYASVKKGAQEIANTVGATGKQMPLIGDVVSGAHAPTNIPGLGDDAYEDGLGIHVLKGSTILEISVGALSEKRTDLTLDAAKKAVARLP